MEQLRIILLILGVVLVGAIWLAETLRRRRANRSKLDWSKVDGAREGAFGSGRGSSPGMEAETHPDEWGEATFSARRHEVVDEAQLEGLKGLGNKDDDEFDDIPVLTAVVDPESLTSSGGEPTPSDEEVIVLTVMAPKGRPLRGPLLLKALQEAGLVHGEMEIFHFHVEGHSEPLFSVANILEPGRFILSEIVQFETPGVALFMRLPTVMPGEEALQMLLRKARQIAAQLGASLCDGRRQPLAEDTLAELEQQAEGFPAK
ncbi:MAG: cell division protein ZipA [Pseudomonadota bacterium]